MIRSNTVIEKATERSPDAAPAELVPLAELTAEGFGWAGQFVKTPRDAIDALARQLDGAVVLDDLGRRCTDRDTARRLIADRAERERRQREQEERLRAQRRRSRPRRVSRGVPADQIPADTLPVQAMTQAARDAAPRRQSVLEEALGNRDGALTYHPIKDGL